MKIALTLYTLREFVQKPQDMAKTFKKVKEIGYNAVQLSALGPIDKKELKRMLDDAGLYVCATHVSFQTLTDELRKTVEEHHILSCPHMAIASIPVEMRNEEGYHRFALECNRISRDLRAEGLKLSYHNHAFELARFGERTGLDIIYQESQPEYLFAEIDTYWIQYGGGDPTWWIRKMKNRIKIIHFKDMGIIDNMPTMFEVGEGNLNWQEIIEACKYSGVEWIIVEQDICKRDPFVSVEISFKNLRAMGLQAY